MQARILDRFLLLVFLRMGEITDRLDLEFHRFPVVTVTFSFKIEKSVVRQHILVFDFVPFVTVEKMILFVEKRYPDIPDTDRGDVLLEIAFEKTDFERVDGDRDIASYR